MRRLLTAMLAMLMLTGCAQAALCVRMDDAAALLDRSGGEIVVPGTYADIVPLGGGLYAACDATGRYGLMDESGEVRTDFLYDQLRWADGLLLAELNGLWGMLDAEGCTLGRFAYSWMQPNGAGGAWAIEGDRSDAESDLLLSVSSTGVECVTGLRVHAVGDGSDGLLSVQLPGTLLYGYCDASGELAIPAQYEYAGDFVDGLAVAVKDGLYGAIDISGAWVLEPAYDFLQISEAGSPRRTRRSRTSKGTGCSIDRAGSLRRRA